ncbi:MAG: type I glutamate--ammonia ligase [Thermotogaceae bacterium]|nr:type I glutamate--ammonia ligase [Thermotogaceae bacterium]
MTIEEIFNMIRDEKIQFIRLQFSDINGTLKNVEVPSQEIKRAFESGIMFDGSSIEGFARIEESDMFLKPDPETFAILPWSTDGIKSARVICDIYKPNGEPFEGDPRYRLKLVVNKARSLGFEIFAGPEIEFFVLPRDNNGFPVAQLLDHGSYFDLLPLNKVESLRSEVAVALKMMGIDVEASHHEVAPSQHEVDFRYSKLVRAADNTQTVKLVIKTLAVRHGLCASFMPKPFFNINGSGMHTHLSLFHNGTNAFSNPNDSQGLSDTLLHFVGGILTHAREITAITNPTVNSYKRLVPGYEAPVNVAWSMGNRSSLVRIPMVRGSGTRIEYRAPDPSCNAYLAFAVIVAAGLKGIEEKIQVPQPVEQNIYSLNENAKGQLDIQTLPCSLKEALDLMKRSDLVRDVLGEHIFKKFLDLKRREWREYSIHVTDWEVHKYIDV